MDITLLPAKWRREATAQPSNDVDIRATLRRLRG